MFLFSWSSSSSSVYKLLQNNMYLFFEKNMMYN